MAERWFKLKAFLYFGGAAIIIIGGIIVVNAPYHYIGFVATTGDSSSFDIYDQSGYYPQLEIAVIVNAENSSIITADFVLTNNDTLEVHIVNITLTSGDLVEDTEPPVYRRAQLVDLQPGDYTIEMAKLSGAGWADVSYKQMSDSRTYIVVGGAMNIVGLIMGAAGYFVPGSLIPTGDETIIDWGYEPEDQKEPPQQ